MNTQELSPKDMGKSIMSLGVMLRRVAEGKISFEAALASPFASYFCAIKALNIQTAEQQNVFLFFLSKVVRLQLPLQAEVFVSIFYQMENLYASAAMQLQVPKPNKFKTFSLLDKMMLIYPSYNYVLQRLKSFEKQQCTAPKTAEIWFFILNTAVSDLGFKREAKSWWDYISFLSVGKGLDKLPKAIFPLIKVAFFKQFTEAGNPVFGELKEAYYHGFNRLITFYLTDFTGKLFPTHQLELLLEQPAFYPNFYHLHSNFGGLKVEKALMYLPNFALTAAITEKDWLLALANGESILTIRQPYLVLTKKMAHLFTQAPVGYNFEQAIKYGYVKASGVSNDVVNAFVQNHAVPATQKLWDMFLYLIKVKESESSIGLEQHELTQIGPMIDYMNMEYAQNPNYSVKGRNWRTLLESTNAWHEQYQRPGQQFYKWAPSTIEPFEVEQGSFSYRIFELTDSNMLADESAKMHHCVYSYSYNCYMGYCRIFSLRKYTIIDGVEIKVERLVTIELQSKSIVQARKRFNAFPTTEDRDIITLWLKKNQNIRWTNS